MGKKNSSTLAKRAPKLDAPKARALLAPFAELMWATQLLRLGPASIMGREREGPIACVEANWRSGAPALTIWSGSGDRLASKESLGSFLASWLDMRQSQGSAAWLDAYKDVAWAAIQRASELGREGFEQALSDAGSSFVPRGDPWRDRGCPPLGMEQTWEWLLLGHVELGRLPKMMMGPASSLDPLWRARLEGAVLSRVAEMGQERASGAGLRI